MRYINHYECPCGEQWIDEWDCACNDKCPACNKEVEPHHSEDTYEGMSLAELLRRHDTGSGAPADTVERAATLLEDIHRLVDGVEWDSTTTSDLCDLLTAEGFEIRDVVNEYDEQTDLHEEHPSEYPKLISNGAKRGTLAVELGPDEYIERRGDARAPSVATIEHVRGGQCLNVYNFWVEQAEQLIRDIAKNEHGSQAQGYVDLIRSSRQVPNRYPEEPDWAAANALSGTRYKP